MKGTFDAVKANEAQKNYCKEKGYPHFAPVGKCFRCNKNIYEVHTNKYTGYESGISVERAGSELITGCPHCNWSYCD